MRWKWIALALAGALVCGMMPAAFAAENEAQLAAQTLYELGLFQGTGTDADGAPVFDLDRAPSRNEAVTMLVRLLGKEDEAKAESWDTPFTDVADWAKPYVGYAYENSLTTGTGETTFGGDTKIDASQYLTFVLRALGYESGTDFRWDAAWELSDAIGITADEYAADSDFLRGDVAEISLSTLGAEKKDTDTMLVSQLVDEGAVDGSAAIQHGFDVYGWLGDIHYLYDIRTFTVFAFMNYTGYDDNNRRPITGVREAVRADLAAMDLDLSSPDYYRAKGLEDIFYIQALEVMGDAPDFAYLTSNSTTKRLSDLPQKLAEFYTVADIPALYEKYRPDYQVLLDAYEKEGSASLLAAIDHFDAAPYLPDGFGLEVNLLFAFERGHATKAERNQYGGYAWVLTGPSNANGGVNTINLVHEYEHLVMGPILNRHDAEISSLSRYFDRNAIAVTREGYDRWVDIVNESFVRAVSGYFVEGYGRKYADDDTAKGFTMTRYIYDRIPEFETFDGDLEDFIVLLLEEYPQYAN